MVDATAPLPHITSDAAAGAQHALARVLKLVLPDRSLGTSSLSHRSARPHATRMGRGSQLQCRAGESQEYLPRIGAGGRPRVRAPHLHPLTVCKRRSERSWEALKVRLHLLPLAHVHAPLKGASARLSRHARWVLVWCGGPRGIGSGAQDILFVFTRGVHSFQGTRDRARR